jgi:hypothetical protein
MEWKALSSTNLVIGHFMRKHDIRAVEFSEETISGDSEIILPTNIYFFFELNQSLTVSNLSQADLHHSICKTLLNNHLFQMVITRKEGGVVKQHN